MRALPLVLVPALALHASRSFALDFDDAGNLQFAPNAAVTQGFEGAAATPVTPTKKGFSVRESPDALEGTKVGFVNSDSFDQIYELPLVLPAKDAAFKAHFFVRKNRVLADVDVTGGTLSEVSARFYPTGRVTSDGWYEVETAPFTVQSTQGAKATLRIFASGAELDGLEVIEVGPARTLKACSGASDAVCGVSEFCAARTCHDGALGLPALPAEAFRASFVDYLKKRLEFFFGGRITRDSTMPTALATLEKMKSAGDAWTFWNGFATAVRQLRDWHTKMEATVTVAGRGALPVCFVEGDGDLSHGSAPKDPSYPDVLVSHVGPDQNFGLKPGDRIVAVNGKHPVAFMDSLEAVNWDLWRANDPNGHAEKLENLRKAIRRWAKDFTVVKCDPTSKTCSAPEVVPVSALSDVEPDLYPECDHRPLYHLAAADSPDALTHRVDGVNYGQLANTDASEKLWGMVWNSVYLDGGGQNPYAAPIDALRANAKGIVLDHRTGNGGTELAAEYLTELFRAPATLGVATGFNFTLGFFDATKTPAGGLEIFNARRNGDDAFNVGSPTARTQDLRTALLLARDGSASDWFPYGMRGTANVRLFGRRTAGAFSSYLSFDYFGMLSFRLASGDFISADGATQIGVGVQPDEDIVPKQSDLLAGRDTVYERALAWVRSGQ